MTRGRGRQPRRYAAPRSREAVIVGRVPEPGETAVCPGCGQDVPLKPCRRVPDPGVDLVNGGPTFALHYTPDTETTRSTVCMAYLTARPEESR